MRLTIKTKLAATFVAVVALSGVSMFLALQSLGRLNDSLGEIVDVQATNTIAISDVQTSLESISSRLRAMIISSDFIAAYLSIAANPHSSLRYRSPLMSA